MELSSVPGNRDAALLLVAEPTFRAWRIWLAASALSFEDGLSSVYQVLMSKRGAACRLLTRENMHSDPGPNERFLGHGAEALQNKGKPASGE